jgi:hypothetical protein
MHYSYEWTGLWRKHHHKRSPNNKRHKGIHGAFKRLSMEGTKGKTLLLTITVAQVVDTTTTRDTSLIASLGEYLSPFSLVVLYHVYPVMF